MVNVLANGVSQGVPVSFGTQTEVQGATSKGWEVSAFGSITNRLSLIANYTDMKTSQAFTGQQNAAGWNTTTNNPGTIPLRFAPDWNANVFAKYSLRDARGQGWELKAGIAGRWPALYAAHRLRPHPHPGIAEKLRCRRRLPLEAVQLRPDGDEHWQRPVLHHARPGAAHLPFQRVHALLSAR
ncbi:MAG: TonB-dependent receptor [Pirellulales bacterium]